MLAKVEPTPVQPQVRRKMSDNSASKGALRPRATVHALGPVAGLAHVVGGRGGMKAKAEAEHDLRYSQYRASVASTVGGVGQLVPTEGGGDSSGHRGRRE